MNKHTFLSVGALFVCVVIAGVLFLHKADPPETTVTAYPEKVAEATAEAP